MVLHVLKSNPALRELEHVQVDAPDLVYLFFYDRHGHQGLMKEATFAKCSHLVDAFAEWIPRSTHFKVVPLLLEEGCNCSPREMQKAYSDPGKTQLANSCSWDCQLWILTAIGRWNPTCSGRARWSCGTGDG